LDEAEIPASGFTCELDVETLTAHPAASAKVTQGFVNCVYALERQEEALPNDRLLVTDGGRFMTEVWCRLSVQNPQSFVCTVNFGAFGSGFQEAVGAGLAGALYRLNSILNTGSHTHAGYACKIDFRQSPSFVYDVCCMISYELS